MMSATIQLAMRGGAAVALPVLTVSVLTLLKPLLPPRFWRFLIIFIPVTVACFLLGTAFVYYVMLPVGLGFLLNFGAGVAVPVILLSEYIRLLTSLMFWVGVVFELPIAMYLLVKLRAVSYQRFRGFRKYVPIAALILGAILTPTFDAVNQLMLAVPIVALYEVGLFLSWVARPEDGNYLWFNTIGRWLRKVRDGLAWVLRRPVVMIRWVRWSLRNVR